jgi:cytochrome c oxidase assembly protein subunit 15
MGKTASKIRFQKVNIITIFSLFVLILAGAVVRSSGSGMGCPDWPKCFGRYVPPTNVNQLPKDYKQKYISGNTSKNQRFAKMLKVFGFADLSGRIRNDKSVLVPEEFNAARTWTEYINRLIGAVTGIFLLLTAIFAFSYWNDRKRIAILSIFNVLLVVFQAWLGALVVSTNLVPWVVTVHMLLALAILAISIATYHIAKVYGKPELTVSPIVHVVTLLTLILSIVQITFGAEVREKIDSVASRLQGGYRDEWISRAGAIFMQHRDIAVLVLLLNVVLYVLIRHGFSRHSVQQQLMSFTFLVLMLQIVTGISLSYWSLPAFSQAVHIVLASLMFGAQFYLMLNLYKSAYLQGAQR